MSFTESLFGISVELETIATIWKCYLSGCNVKQIKMNGVEILPELTGQLFNAN